MDSYDCIVAGVGGAGSSALFHLAARGCKVLGLDRFTPGHDRGSSHGDTRIIRMAYFEHPDYVPLLKRAHHLWDQLEEARGEKLRYETGLLQAGPAGGFIVEGVLRSAREHSLEVEELRAAEAAGRFKGFALDDSMEAVYEKGAGYLLVENCVKAHAEEALAQGAQLETGVNILRWREQGDGVIVETDRGAFQAANLVITPGAWAPDLLQTVGVSLEVRRKHLYWFRCPREQYRDSSGFPAFVFETSGGFFYGFPCLDGESIKVARHCGGQQVADPLEICRELEEDDLASVRDFLGSYLPGVEEELTRHEVCFYTCTPDEHFIFGRHPECERVVFAAGLSGHGFKFTSVLGEMLACMCSGEDHGLPVDFLDAGREGLFPS